MLACHARREWLRNGFWTRIARYPMHIARCLIALPLVLLAAVSAPAAGVQPPKTGQTICSDASANVSGCAGASQNGGAAIASSSPVISIWGGARETIALKEDGTVWTWGLNDCVLGSGTCGKLGDATQMSRSLPIQVHGPGNVGYLTSITAIMGGEHANYALKSDGTVWAWGAYNTGVGALLAHLRPFLCCASSHPPCCLPRSRTSYPLIMRSYLPASFVAERSASQ